MSIVDDIVAELPLAVLAERLGLREETVRQAVQLAVPALMGAMKANIESEPGALSLSAALEQHEAYSAADAIDLAGIDVHDGERIVAYLLGDQREDIAGRLGRVAGDADPSDLGRLMPLIAPVVMGHMSRVSDGGDSVLLSRKLSELSNGSSSGMQIQNMLGDLLGGGRR